MIIGAHAIVMSTQPEADRSFFRDVLELPHVDVGGGWLIFGLPPSEVAVHDATESESHEMYLMCDNVEDFVEEMLERGVSCSEIKDEGWGLLTRVTLPGGGTLGVYEPRHSRPESPGAAPPAAAARAAKKRKVAAKHRPSAAKKAAGKQAAARAPAKKAAKKKKKATRRA